MDWPTAIVYVASVLAIAGMMIAILLFGVNESSTPIMLSVVTSLGTLVTAIVAANRAQSAALSSKEAREYAEHGAKVGELTASKVSTLQQQQMYASDHPCHDPECKGPP